MIGYVFKIVSFDEKNSVAETTSATLVVVVTACREALI
jgi:hypothetical protein